MVTHNISDESTTITQQSALMKISKRNTIGAFFANMESYLTLTDIPKTVSLVEH